jgi:CMP-N-acetylneuraminic acid synthetase
MKVLGLIPARGGSKGIPNKNQKELGGKPLLQYTIESALGSTLLDAVVFSSEDATLRDLAENMGASVPFKRPDALATDVAGSLEVVQHALAELEKNGQNFDAVCLLQVTTPFRSSDDIDAAISKFKSEQSDSLISVQIVPHQFNPHWVFELAEGKLKIATGEDQIIKRRQELPDAFIRDGAIYITKAEVIQKQNSFFGTTISYIELDTKGHVNIDTPEDWEKAELIHKKRYF